MTVRVFISATFSDLRDERLELLEVFRRFRTVRHLDIDVITMEDFGFSDAAPLEKCLEQVDRADAYLGLIGFRYGSIAPDHDLSFTELEYRRAHDRGIPVFVLQKDGLVRPDQIENDPQKLAKLNALKAHAQKHHVVHLFKTRSDLGQKVGLHLPEELDKRYDISMAEDIEIRVPYFQQQARPHLLKTDDAPSVKTLDVLAWSTGGFLRDRGFIERYIEEGVAIRILNLQRGGRAVALVADVGNKPDFDRDLEAAVRRARRFMDFAEGHDGSLELRELDWLATSTLFMADGKLPSARVWVGSYTPDPRTPGGQKWTTELLASTHPEAVSFYMGQFEQLWKEATIV